MPVSPQNVDAMYAFFHLWAPWSVDASDTAALPRWPSKSTIQGEVSPAQSVMDFSELSASCSGGELDTEDDFYDDELATAQ